MTARQKAETLFQILKCSPATESLAEFKSHVKSGNAEAMWTYYVKCLRLYPAKDAEIEAQGLVSFRMLEKAMAEVHKLPVKG